MSTTLLNERRYAELLRKTLPAVIHTEPEYRRFLGIAKELMETPDEDLTEEEGRMLELLAMVIEEYEDRAHPLPKVSPGEMLAHLLNEKDMTAADLADIMPKSRVSEILGGKRNISKSQAKQLAGRFHVPVELFL